MKKSIIILILMLLSTTLMADSIGMIVSLEGSATALGENGASRTLAVKSDIFLNDTVNTGAGSKLQILLNDDSIFAQGENSEMTIDEYIYTPNTPSENGFGVKLGQGLFRTVTGKITDLNPDRFEVRTARATIGIRGCDLGFNITPTEDNISVITIPAGKQIFVNPLQGDESALLETPTVVVVDDEGGLESRPLTPEDRSSVQQGTTPTESNDSADEESDDTSGGTTTGSSDTDSSTDDGSTGTGDESSDTTDTSGTGGDTTSGTDLGVLDEGSVVQDTNQGLSEHILSGSEIDQIIAGTQEYFLTGSGTASADVHTFNGVIDQDFVLTGPASVSVEIGNGLSSFDVQMGLLTDGNGNELLIQTASIPFDGSTDLVLDDTADISSIFLSAGGSIWEDQDLANPGTVVSADGNLYGNDGNSAPTAAELINGEIDLVNGGGDEAYIDFSTSKIELQNQ